MKVLRQGDVGIVPTKNKTEKLIEKENKILAHGEVTGHAHRVTTKDARVYAANALADAETATELVIRAYTPTEVTHEEHEGIVVPVGDHRVVIQREFSWASKLAKRVVD